MKKLLSISALIFLIGISFSGLVIAQSNDIAPLADEFGTPITDVGGGVEILLEIVKWIYTIFFLLAIIFILMSAYNFVSGGDNADKIKKAKSQLKWAIIGIGLGLISASISLLVSNFLGGGSGSGGAGGVNSL